MDFGSQQASENKQKEASLDSFDSLETEDTEEDFSTSDNTEGINHPSLRLNFYEHCFNNSKGSHDSPSNSRGILETEGDDTNTPKTSSTFFQYDNHAPISPIRESSSDWASQDSLTPKSATSDAEIEVQKQNNFSERLESLISQMEKQYEDHAIDRAYRILESIKKLSKSEGIGKNDQETLKTRLNEKKVLVSDIERFYQETTRILKELQDEEGYLVESNKKNSIIKYKNLSEGKVSIKMESTLEVPLATLLGLFYEPDGYKMWSPFVQESHEIKKLFRAGTATKLKWNLPPPVFAREGYLIGVGFDRLQENGSLLLISRTIHDDKQIQQRYNLDIPTGSKTVRMDINYVGVELVPLTPEKTQMRIVAMFDPKIKILPARFVSWIVRKGAHYLLEKIVKSATNPKRAQENKYADQNKEFYGWLDNLLSNYFNKI
jgi:hypothetical protein